MRHRVEGQMGFHQLALLKLEGRVACSQQLRSTPQQLRSPISCEQSCAPKEHKPSKGKWDTTAVCRSVGAKGAPHAASASTKSGPPRRSWRRSAAGRGASTLPST